MNIEGGGWGSSPLTSLANHQKLNVIQKRAFYFFGWRGVVDGVRVHRPAWPIIRSERNPKMRISFFWLERGGGWGSSPSISLANHQQLNVIQKQAFYIFGWRGMANGVRVHRPAWPIIRSERNPKMSILFFWLERSGGWVSSPLTSPADHQKLNVIQKRAFYFLAGEGWWMGFESINQPSQSPEVECNPKMSILFFWLERAGGWGSSLYTHLKLKFTSFLFRHRIR